MMRRLRGMGISWFVLGWTIFTMVHHCSTDLFVFVSISDAEHLSIIVSSKSFSNDSSSSITTGSIDKKFDMCKVFDLVDLSSDSLEGRQNLGYVPSRMQNNLVNFVDSLCRQAFDLYYADEKNGNSSSSMLDGFRYRARPNILGTEHCEAMRNKYGPALRIAIAGMFNTGTNAIARNLQANIGIPGHENDIDTPSSEATLNGYEVDRNGVDYQVPWWKHHPDIFNTSLPLHRDPSIHSHILPIVMVRDPLNWMQSTCINRYDLSWHTPPSSGRIREYRHLKSASRKKPKSPLDCPKIGFLDRKTNESTTTPVRLNLRETLNASDIKYTKKVQRGGKEVTKVIMRPSKMLDFESILHVWNGFYKQYFTADFPRLLVRFEDAMYMFPQVLDEIQNCVHGYSKSNTTEQRVRMAKVHGGRSNLWSALRTNSDASLRMQVLSTPSEKQYARSVLDSTLMEGFHYKMP